MTAAPRFAEHSLGLRRVLASMRSRFKLASKAENIDCFSGHTLRMTGRTVVPVEVYDSRISSSRRPSVFSSFLTALEAMTSPWLA